MAAPYRGSIDPTEAEIQERIDMLATDEAPAAVAARFGLSIGSVYNFASRHRERIADRREELTGVVNAKAADNWIIDQVAAHDTRRYLAESTLLRREEPDLPARDYSKFTRDIDILIHRSTELAGLLPTRVHAQVTEVPYGEVIGGFDEPGVEPEPYQPSEPKRMPDVPAEHRGRVQPNAGSTTNPSGDTPVGPRAEPQRHTYPTGPDQGAFEPAKAPRFLR